MNLDGVSKDALTLVATFAVMGGVSGGLVVAAALGVFKLIGRGIDWLLDSRARKAARA